MYKVYLLRSSINDSNLYKIGFTRRNIEDRVKELKTGNAADITIVSYYESKWATKIESTLHRLYDYRKVSGEWFELSDDIVDDFKDICEKLDNNFNILSEKLF